MKYVYYYVIAIKSRKLINKINALDIVPSTSFQEELQLRKVEEIKPININSLMKYLLLQKLYWRIFIQRFKHWKMHWSPITFTLILLL